MTVQYLGGLSVGGAVPGAALAVSAGMSGINAALDNLLAQLDALNAFAPVSISFAAQLSLAQEMVLKIGEAITLGLAPPNLALQIAMIAAQAAALAAQIAGIQVQLEALSDLQAPLAVVGVHGYAFDGDTNDLGSEIGAELSGGVPGGGPTDHANAVVLITTSPAAWTAMGQILKVAP